MMRSVFHSNGGIRCHAASFARRMSESIDDATPNGEADKMKTDFSNFVSQYHTDGYLLISGTL
jgi:hypothetical protein